jgi:hypothetical protein
MRGLIDGSRLEAGLPSLSRDRLKYELFRSFAKPVKMAVGSYRSRGQESQTKEPQKFCEKKPLSGKIVLLKHHA